MDLKEAIGHVEAELLAEQADARADLIKGSHVRQGEEKPNDLRMERTQVAVMAGSRLARYALHVALNGGAADLDEVRRDALAFLITDEGQEMAVTIRNSLMAWLEDNRSVPPYRVIRTARDLILFHLEDDEPAEDEETYAEAAQRLEGEDQVSPADAELLRRKFADACAHVLLEEVSMPVNKSEHDADAVREILLAALRTQDAYDAALRIWHEVQGRFAARHVVPVHRVVIRAREIVAELYPPEDAAEGE